MAEPLEVPFSRIASETWGVPAPTGLLYVGIDIGRRQHLAAAIPEARMWDGSWERAPARTIATTALGFRGLIGWLGELGFALDQTRIGPNHVAAADPADLHRVVVCQGYAGGLATRLMDLQMAAADSAGLSQDTDAVVHTQEWLLYQLRLIDGQIQQVEAAIAAVLEEWSAEERTILASFPAMTTVRQAVLLASIGDIACFRDDRQMRKLLGWYPEARESGSSVSRHRLGSSGNRMARRELWLWTLELISRLRPTTPFRDYYRRLRERGMAGHVAMGHLAGKLISVVFHCLRSATPYDPQRHARDLGTADACRRTEA